MTQDDIMTRDEIRTIIQNELAAVSAPRDRCTPDNPHSEMTYQRGPNRYHCRCGQTYAKDGSGGLREVT